MSQIAIATSQADAGAVEAVEAHHAELRGALTVQVAALVDATVRSGQDAAARAGRAVLDWCAAELLPHAFAEEETLYPAAHGTVEGRLLVEAMLGEHALIGTLVAILADQLDDPVRAAATATALRVVFDSHLGKENDLVLPLLAGSPDVSLAALLEGMHDRLGGEAVADQEGEGAWGTHACACGEQDPTGLPELDARAIPHAIRHATIFGALEAVGPGGGLVLLAPHDPVPLLAQVAERWPGLFAVDYLDRGPETWRLALTRSAS